MHLQDLFDDKGMNNYKIKERAVVESVLKEFPDTYWICDKTIPGGCNAKFSFGGTAL